MLRQVLLFILVIDEYSEQVVTPDLTIKYISSYLEEGEVWDHIQSYKPCKRISTDWSVPALFRISLLNIRLKNRSQVVY